jgi:hypothetical protein
VLAFFASPWHFFEYFEHVFRVFRACFSSISSMFFEYFEHVVRAFFPFHLGVLVFHWVCDRPVTLPRMWSFAAVIVSSTSWPTPVVNRLLLSRVWPSASGRSTCRNRTRTGSGPCTCVRPQRSRFATSVSWLWPRVSAGLMSAVVLIPAPSWVHLSFCLPCVFACVRLARL